MANLAVAGVNWGDEGKGRVTDYLAHDYDIVVRSQGGANAGHTIVNGIGRFVLNALPAGVFSRKTICVIGAGTAVNIKSLSAEIEHLSSAAGLSIGPDRLLISDRASLVLPVHADEERWEEDRLGDRSLETMVRGLGPAYADRHRCKSLLTGDLLYPDTLKRKLTSLLSWKNSVICKGYGVHRIDMDEAYEWLMRWREGILPYIADTDRYLDRAGKAGMRILFEGQSGALRDPLYGNYPAVNSSSVLVSAMPYSSGCPSLRIDRVIGVTKAYSASVSSVPFVGTIDETDAETIRESGSEYGAATGRPRRVGWFDAVATRRGIHLQGATELVVTKLDVLSSFAEIPVITGYRLDGKVLRDMPFTDDITKCEPVLKVLPGWQCDITQARSFDSLPKEARDYIAFIEKETGIPVTMITVGPMRDEVIVR